MTLSASDAQNDNLSFSLAPGDDEDLFVITSQGELSFIASPDFESPTDSGADSVYKVTVQVSDGSLSDTQALTVTVTDAFLTQSRSIRSNGSVGGGGRKQIPAARVSFTRHGSVRVASLSRVTKCFKE